MTPQDGDGRLYRLAVALVLACLLMAALFVAGGLWWAYDVLTQTTNMTFNLKELP